jgi:hypothetical protein
MRGFMRNRVLLVVLVVTVLGALAAQAQRKKITLDDLVIDGNIQKPAAFFILPRSNLNLADLDRREDLKSRIVEAVEAAPF